MASSSAEKKPKNVKVEYEKVTLPEDFIDEVKALPLDELKDMKDEIQTDANLVMSKLKLVSELVAEKESTIKKEESDRRAKERADEKKETERVNREQEISFRISVSWEDVPMEFTKPKNTILSEVRDEIAMEHPSYATLKTKKAKEDFVKNFVLELRGKKIAGKGKMARPTLGEGLKMVGGETMLGFSASEIEEMEASSGGYAVAGRVQHVPEDIVEPPTVDDDQETDPESLGLEQ